MIHVHWIRLPGSMIALATASLSSAVGLLGGTDRPMTPSALSAPLHAFFRSAKYASRRSRRSVQNGS